MKLIILILFSILFFKVGISQEKNEIIQQRIEFIAEQNNSESIDLTVIFEQLNYYFENPIDINNCTFEELEELNLLTDIQIQELIIHEKIFGKFITIYELQTLQYWDLNTIQRLLPFITLNEQINSPNMSFKSISKYAKIQLSNRLQFAPENLKIAEQLPSNSAYLGSPYRIYSRFKYSYRNNLSIGITADKDAGEPFQKYNNGFDYYSSHVYYQGGKHIKKLVIGDYSNAFGQGLTLWTNYAFGKTADVINVKKNANTFKPYTSTDETRFLRGIAIDLGTKNITFSPFISLKKIDATTNYNQDSTFSFFSSIQTSGYHRTSTEIERKNKAIEKIAGISINASIKNLKLGGLFLYQGYDKPYLNDKQLYNQFQFRGKEQVNIAGTYSWLKANKSIFGESSYNLQSRGWANIHGVIISLSNSSALSLIYRNYSKTFNSFYNYAFADGSNPFNEQGFFAGLRTKINSKINLNIYADFFQSKWLKHQVNAPSIGHDLLSQINFKISSQTEVYIRVRNQNHQKNNRFSTPDIPDLIDNIQNNFRIHFTHSLNENFSIRSRFEWVTLSGYEKEIQKGYLMYQDFIYKPKVGKLDFGIRFAIFDTDNYATRIYAFESNAQNVFSIPAHYDKGFKTYILLKTQITKYLDLWFRYGSSFYQNEIVYNYGNNTMNSKTKSDFTFQVSFKI